MKQRFPVGTRFKPMGKAYICTVIDFLTTTNLAGDVVKCEYLATHDFCGQIIEARYTDTTIARGGALCPDPST